LLFCGFLGCLFGSFFGSFLGRLFGFLFFATVEELALLDDHQSLGLSLLHNATVIKARMDCSCVL
jgi:hypothetical protein